jgi:hypothetical protein
MDATIRRCVGVALALTYLFALLGDTALGANPAILGSLTDTTHLTGASNSVAVGHFAYVLGWKSNSINVVDVSDDAHPVLVGSTTTASMAGPATLAVSNGYAYVVARDGNSLTVVDVHTPTAPAVVGSVADPVKLWGAYSVALSGHYAYVAAQGCLSAPNACPNSAAGNRLVVIDIAVPSAPQIVADLYDATKLSHVDGIDVQGKYAYLAAAYSSRVTIVDISNPAAPFITGSVADSSLLRVGADLKVRGRFAYVPAQGASRLTVVDVSNPVAPTIAGSVNAASLNNAYDIDLRGNTVVVAAAGSNAVTTVDVSNPASPVVSGTVSSATLKLADGIGLVGTRAYAAAYSGNSLVVADVGLTDTAPSDTTLTGGPTGTSTATSATFDGAATEPDSTFECRLDGAAWSACTLPVTYSATTDGTHTFDLRSVDWAGNRDATPASRTWTVDATPPDTSIGSGPSGTVNATTAAFAVASTKPGSTFSCALDGAAFAPCSSSPTYTGLSDGPHTFDTRATDAVGNMDPTPATRTWTVDTVAPDTSIDSGPSGAVGSSSASFGVSSSEPGSTFECGLDGAAFAACASSPSYAGLADGAHTLVVRAIDVAGNVDGSPASRAWTVDTIAPDTSITAGPSGTTNSTAASIAFAATEAGSTFVCSLDAGAWAPCASPAALSGLADGAHSFAVQAIDPAGNTDPTPASRTWAVDATAPVVAFYRAPDATWPSTSAAFSSADSEDVTGRQCRLDTGAWAACAGQVTLTKLSQGTHTYQMRATDMAGNPVAAPASWTFNVTGTGTQPTPGPVAALGGAQASVDVALRRAGANGLLAADGITVTVPSPGAGRMAIALVAPTGTPPTAVARGAAIASASGSVTVRLRLSAAGRTLLRGIKGSAAWSLQIGLEGTPPVAGVWPQTIPDLGNASASSLKAASVAAPSRCAARKVSGKGKAGRPSTSRAAAATCTPARERPKSGTRKRSTAGRR